MKFEWEVINKKEKFGEFIDATERARVIGGWLIRSHLVSTFNESDMRSHEIKYCSTMSTQFVHDPNHEWKIDE